MKKIPFDLNKWLADLSQEVVTRDGKPVRILCTDCKAGQPIVALVTFTYEGGSTYESVESYSENGFYFACGNKDADLDLFLVTEDEPELTEFEEAVQQTIQDSEFNEDVCNKLLAIARKQLKAEGWEYTDPLLKEIMEERVPKTEETGTRDEHFDDLFDDYYDKNWEDGMSLEQCAKHFYNLGKSEALKKLSKEE